MKTAESAPAASFAELGLSGPVLAALVAVGYEAPSPIQAATIPALLAAYAPVGPLKAHGSVALSRLGDLIDVKQIDARVTNPAGGLFRSWKRAPWR